MKKLCAWLLSALLLIGLCSCGSSSYEAAESVEDYDGGVDTFTYETAEMEEDAAEVTASSAEDVSAMEEKMVYTAEISAQTLRYDEAVEQLLASVKTAGGYVENRSEYTGGYYDGGTYIAEGNRSVYFTFRIPAEEFEGFLSGLGETLNVTNRSVYSENVTMQYVDLEARIKNLKAQEERLQELLQSAEDMEQLLTIEDHLTDTRTEIEQAEGEMRVLSNRVSYCTVNLSLEETESYAPGAESGFGERLARGVRSSWEKLGRGAENLLVVISNNLLQLLIAAALIYAVVRVVKKKNGLRFQKKERKNKNGDKSSADQSGADKSGGEQ